MKWPGRGTGSAPGRQLDRQAQELVRLGAINRSTLTEWMGVCSDSQAAVDRPSAQAARVGCDCDVTRQTWQL